MKALYTELQLLCTIDQATKAVQTAAIEGTPEEFRKEMCKATRKYIVPGIPEGRIRWKGCFWFTFNIKGVWECAWGANDEKKDRIAEWLKAKRETAQKYGRPWPPAPVYTAAFTLPQHRTGKE